MNVNEQMQDPRRLAEEIDELAGTSDHNAEGNTLFAADMASVLASSESAFDAQAVRYFHRLRDRVRNAIQHQADEESEAAAEREWEEGEEARAFARDISREFREAA